MGIMNDLHAVGLNPFGVQLVAESLLKSPIAPMSAGVTFTNQPDPNATAGALSPAQP